MSQYILQTDKLTIQFGGIVAVNQVSLSVKPGIIFGLIGPNGAGKTTMFNLLTGIYKPTDGKILYKGEDITSLSPHKISALGISRTFQNIRLLKDHTVFENIMLASHSNLSYKFIDALLYSKKYKSEEREKKKLVNELLEKYEMTHLKNLDANDLPQGIQRKIEIVRAIATGAELIFLDEPAAGLNPVETDELMDLVKKLKEEGKTIFLIEHDMKLVKGICDEITVLNFGKKIDQGTYEKVISNPEVIEAYLGRRKQHAHG
ncbi:ABC transporter ATP-binding protein [Peribacillus asahii]|uniref:ABC transporter ATP-binding protein n=1 Tax=Peribacillus asahii TaxID=228899 RepID=UPI00380C4FAA